MAELKPSSELPREIAAEPLLAWRVWAVIPRPRLEYLMVESDQLAALAGQQAALEKATLALKLIEDGPADPDVDSSSWCAGVATSALASIETAWDDVPEFRQLTLPSLAALTGQPGWERLPVSARCNRWSPYRTRRGLGWLTWTAFGRPRWLRRRLWVANSEKQHDPPGADCKCGLWAVKTEEQVFEVLAAWRGAYTTVAYGRVQLWGRVIEHDTGYRAAHAAPYDVVVVDGTRELVAGLRERYAVDVRSGPLPDRVAYYLKRAADEHQSFLRRRLRFAKVGTCFALLSAVSNAFVFAIGGSLWRMAVGAAAGGAVGYFGSQWRKLRRAVKP